MRCLACLAFVALASCLAFPAAAQERMSAPLGAVETLQSRQDRLDALFTELKRERNEKAAERIAGRIWEQWFRSGSASVDFLMQRARKAMEERRFDVALDLLDEVVVLQPDFAEAWNRRATLHFLMNNYAKSMADIDRTLALEPRHFGALSGMAQILRRTGRKELALRAWQQVLEIYPMLRSAQNEVATISEELAGESL